MTNKERAYAVAKAELIQPDEKNIQAARASIAKLADENKLSQTDFVKYAQDNKQEDLLYFKAIYATCGFNLNDDVFINDEFWKARTTPIWKPTNWQHKDPIIGVIYAVQAQKLDGTRLDIESSDVPKEDFEIVVHGAIWKYSFPDYAKDIETRSTKGELFVSMETWFGDYSYALLNKDQSQGTITLVDRNDKTVALSKYLRAYGGSGKFNDKRIGRVLRDITFGGMGIVDNPANPRSAGTTAEIKSEITMADEVKSTVTVTELKDLELVKNLSVAAARVPELEKALAEAKENAERLAKSAEKATLYEKVADAINKEIDAALAGLSATCPPEIAKIDAASSPEALFRAKLAFLTQTGKAFASKVTELEKAASDKAAELEKAVLAAKAEKETLDAKIADLLKFKAEVDAENAAKAKQVRDTMRMAEVSTVFDKSTAEALKSNFLDLEDAAYNKWVEEKKLIASKITLKPDGGQGKPEEEGKSGIEHAKSGPRQTVSVASVLERAKVEQTPALVEPEKTQSVEVGFGALVRKPKK